MDELLLERRAPTALTTRRMGRPALFTPTPAAAKRTLEFFTANHPKPEHPQGLRTGGGGVLGLARAELTLGGGRNRAGARRNLRRAAARTSRGAFGQAQPSGAADAGRLAGGWQVMPMNPGRRSWRLRNQGSRSTSNLAELRDRGPGRRMVYSFARAGAAPCTSSRQFGPLVAKASRPTWSPSLVPPAARRVEKTIRSRSSSGR